MNERTTMEQVYSPESATVKSAQSLQECVDENVACYFAQLGDAPASNVYEMVLAEVEIPLLKRVLKYTRGNQSKAAIVLGISRGTLRKKLKIYGMEGRIKEVIAE
jgi:Fis family transcriptional regulator, factor for inversion stimulation protein